MDGKLIVFEGIDGSGKSTQLVLLRDFLRRRGWEVLVTREPGGTAVGEEIRRVLLDPQYSDLHYRAEAFLYAAARAQLVATTVEPALAQGKLVLCDRFVDSTLAYQGYGRGLSLDYLQTLNGLATAGLQPDKVLIFDLPVDQGLRRVGKRSASDRLEQEPQPFHQRVRQGYLALAAANPQTHIILDASLGVDALHQRVLVELEGLFNASL